MSDESREPEHEQDPAPAAVAAPAAESRRDRLVRQGHHASLWASLVAGIAAAVLLILLIARNTRHVKLDYVFGHTNARLIWLIVISAITGWVLGVVTTYLVRRRARWPRAG